MSFNAIESVKGAFPVEMMNKMAGILGESTANLQQAMQGVIPSVIVGIILKTEYGDAFDTFNLSKEAAKIEIPFNPTLLAWWWSTNYKGVDYLKTLFGGKISDLTHSISRYSGISSKSAMSLLNVVAPAAYCVLGRHILESDMNVNTLRNFLSGEKKNTLNQLPAGIFSEDIMGIENVSGLSENFRGTENQINGKKRKINWVIPVVLIAFTGGLIWYFVIRQEPAQLQSVPKVPQVAAASDTAAKDIMVKDTLVKATIQDSRYSVKLPGGKMLYVKKGSMEDELAAFFNDPKSRPSRRFLYSFDQVKFSKGSAAISSEGMTQIENVAAILIAFPNAKIKIAGFNERGDDSLLNSQLSVNRAESIAKALKTAGVSKNQITGVEGFGSDFAQYESDAPDSLREKDRRISISVRSK